MSKKQKNIGPNHPKCANIGCTEYAAVRHVNINGSVRFRPHCNHCQGASWGRHDHKPGVRPFKTGKCCNHDGHLGFECAINWSTLPTWAKGLTEIDHVNGDNSNNDLSNLQELCVICHKLKGQKNGDFNPKKRTKQRKKQH